MNLEASLHSLLSFAWTLTRPTNFNRLRQYCFLILREDTSFFFLIISLFFVFFCYFTLLLIFTKIILFLLFYYIFFMKIIFIFACSGMFRDVPECSVFLVLSRRPKFTLWTCIKIREFVPCLFWVFTLWPCFRFWVRLFTVHYNFTKIGRFTHFLSIRIVLSGF